MTRVAMVSFEARCGRGEGLEIVHEGSLSQLPICDYGE